MKKIAFVFPGQGSQKVGMGQDLFNAHAQAKAMFAAADEVSGLPITRLCFEGPMEALTETVNLQPAIMAVNLACLTAVDAAGIHPAVCAGHSLGEYAALSAAGVVSPVDCLKLVFKRGQLMHREAMRHKGAMSAIVGLGFEQVAQIVSQAARHGVVAVANHNSAEQIVITGEPEAVQRAADMASEQGARAVPLKVSGAWHSPLIEGARADFESYLDTVEFNAPRSPVIHNVTAEAEAEPAKIRALMAEQLYCPVRWFESMQRMTTEGVDAFVEIGPGRVLAGLLKKFFPKSQAPDIYNVYDIKTLDRFLQDFS